MFYIDNGSHDYLAINMTLKECYSVSTGYVSRQLFANEFVLSI